MKLWWLQCSWCKATVNTCRVDLRALLWRRLNISRLCVHNSAQQNLKPPSEYGMTTVVIVRLWALRSVRVHIKGAAIAGCCFPHSLRAMRNRPTSDHNTLLTAENCAFVDLYPFKVNKLFFLVERYFILSSYYYLLMVFTECECVLYWKRGWVCLWI